MTDINRRGFLGSVAAVVPATVLVHRASEHQLAPTPLRLDGEMLSALARAVLPSELDAAAIDRVVTGFQTWLDGYESAAELNHGYGTGTIRYAPVNPHANWQSQLAALDAEAQQKFGQSFSDLAATPRRDIVRQQLAGDPVDRLSLPQRARHVAIGLLSYYYARPEASDLCYQRAIGKNSCRPLARSPDEPSPLQGGA